MSMMFNPSRLTLARRRRRFSKKELAEAVGVTPHSILRYETGAMGPTDEVVVCLSETLKFPADFFFGADADEIHQDAASFRSLSSISAKDRDAALAAGSLAYMLADWVEERFDLPKPDLLDLTGDTPEIAARSLREKWGLGEQPAKNMVHLLEAKGVRLFSMAENTMAVDAFSVWRRETPYVFLNTMKNRRAQPARCRTRIGTSRAASGRWTERSRRRTRGEPVCCRVLAPGG